MRGDLQDTDMLAVVEHECRKEEKEQCLCFYDNGFCICRDLQATQVKGEARKGGDGCKTSAQSDRRFYGVGVHANFHVITEVQRLFWVVFCCYAFASLPV
jgi:hypothetical protein